MRPTRIVSIAGFLLLVFVIQEGAIARINFPIAGFSLYIAALIGLISLEDRSGAVIIGFMGGLILDLSPSIDAPFGQWALVMTAIGYIFASNRESIGDFAARPGSLVVFVAVGASLSLALFALVGLLLGENNGSINRILLIIAGNAFWTVLFSPVILPPLAKFRNASLTSRERI
jgi:rod shape-determining protein MreD